MKAPRNSSVCTSERDRLAGLLGFVSPERRQVIERRHAPLLSALGILTPPADGYAQAARRPFGDASELREQALAIIDELEREGRMERYEQRRVSPGLRSHYPR